MDEFDCFDRARSSQVTNDKSKEDVKYAIELNRRLAGAIGVWPIFPEELSARQLSLRLSLKRLKNCATYLLLLFLLVPQLLHVVLEEATLKRKLLKTGPMMLNTMALIKYSVMLARDDKVRECLKLLEEDWQACGTERLRAAMRRNAAVGRRLSRACAVTFYCGGLCYRLIRTLLTPSRLTGEGLLVRPLPSPTYAGLFRFNASASPVYELLFAVQLAGGFAVHSTTIATCSYAAVLATHACGQLEIVARLLRRLVCDAGDNGEAAVGRRLRIAVRLHLRALRFIGRVESLLHMVCLVEIVGGTMILCLTSYYFILDLEKNNALGIATYFVMITSLIALLFTYCYIGELVNDKVEKVEAGAYMINWYDLPPNKGACIGLIISISRCSSKLTAGKMLDLSMYNFGSIMRSAAGYLNLLRTMTD